VPKEQIEERLFVVSAARFAQYVKGRVVLMNLPCGDLQAVRTACDPDAGELSRLDACGQTWGGGRSAERSLRPRRRERKEETSDNESRFQNSYLSANCITRAGRLEEPGEVLVEPADVISPNVVGALMLRFVDDGLFHCTLLNALKASPRTEIR
jgi:hypothetical protein